MEFFKKKEKKVKKNEYEYLCSTCDIIFTRATVNNWPCPICGNRTTLFSVNGQR